MENIKDNKVEEKASVEETTVTKKVNRRGIGTARGVSRLKFTHEMAKQNGLFVGHLENVAVSMIKIGEESTGMPSFNGLEIPKIVLTFASNEEEANKRHYVSLSFNAVESNVNTIPGGKEEWKVNAIFDWFKHILDVYVTKGKELTPEQEAALSLPFEDFDEEGNYVAIEPEDVIAGWKVLFENFANILNNGKDGNSYYKTKENKFITVWIKLLRYIKSGKKGWQPINNGELAFPTFVGEGCIEIYKQNTVPSIRIDRIKENIIPMNLEKPKAPNMGTNMMGNNMSPAMGGVPVADGIPNDMNSMDMIGTEDMPF